jgi:hypothetical protein
MDDVVLAYGEVHVDIVPMCPADIRVKDELTADHETDRGWSGRRFRHPDQTPQTPGQNLDTPGLVDEVNGPPLEGEVFLGFEPIAGEEHDRQVHANLAQFDEQFDARYLWKVPVEKDDVSLGGDGEPIGQRHGIGKAMDNKPVIRQLISNGLAMIWVVLDVEDSDGIAFRIISHGLTRLSRLCLIEHHGPHEVVNEPPGGDPLRPNSMRLPC